MASSTTIRLISKNLLEKCRKRKKIGQKTFKTTSELAITTLDSLYFSLSFSDFLNF